MKDDQLLRYSRQIMLPQFDVKGQQALLESTALIVGMGGLGSPVAMYLAAAGVGHLVLVDFDTVDLSNLQRQIIHSTKRIGQSKVLSAADTIASLNPEVKVTAINEKLDESGLLSLITQADVVIDATDNFTIRFLLNKCCVNSQIPLVSGAAIRMEGQVSVFLNKQSADEKQKTAGPCYQCLYRDEGQEAQTCSENGVLAPVVGIIGSIQATEAIKVLTKLGESLNGKLLILDAMNMEWRTIKLKKDPACSVCGT